jgi:hypothetical protein
MRLKMSLVAIAATAAGGVGFLFANAPANAVACPPGFRQQTVLTVPVTGNEVRPCLPYQQCDPGACPSTAPPQQ